MVGPTPPQVQTQPPAQTPSFTAVAATSSAEEEALKRNTDCVYFLASPLTCKKGSECEYRHSDIARLNPRDCWYWLNGSCLNPKCGFRHPPLDGIFGAQVPTPTGSSVPPGMSVAPTPQVFSKQGVPCIFFQKGLCLKGDRCPFFHGPNSTSNKALLPPVSNASNENSTVKKAFGGLEKCVQEKKFFQGNIQKSGELPAQAQSVGKLETPLTKDSNFNENVLLANSVTDVAHHRYRPKSVPPANENPVSRSNRVQHSVGFDDHSSILNNDDEISREPSPGFDVLVDDELRGSDYYHGEDQYHIARGNDGRNEYDIDHPSDYTSVADVDQDMYHDVHGYDSNDRIQGRAGWVQRRASSERIQGEAAHLERRSYGRADSPEQVGESDLRHRLSKHKRVNGLRSVISHDYASEKHVDDRGYQSSRMDRLYLSSHDTSRTGRLQGRIKLPSRSSSPTNRTDMRFDREMDRARSRGRLSLERPQLSSQHGRLRDRIKGRVQEDLDNGGRSNRGPRQGRDISENNSDFAGPKSLAELKGRKTAENNEQNVNEQHALGKRKFQRRDGYQQSGEDLSFKGPMPLEEILKRKRRSETGMTSDKSEEYHQERKDPQMMTPSISRDESDLVQKEESDPPSGDNNGPQETKSALHNGENELEAEEGMIVEGAEDQDLEGHDQDGDYDCEQGGEDYNLDEGENADGGEEYLDEDDDDFAKKMGVVFS